MTTRDAYIAKLKLQLDELNASMAKLEVKAEAARDEARAKYNEEMVKVRHQSKLANEKMEELKVVSEDSWDSMVASTEKVRDAFVHSFHYFKSQV